MKFKGAINWYNCIWGLLIIVAVVTLLIGCSTTNSGLSWIQFWDSPEGEKFVSDVRPVAGNPDSHYLLDNYYQAKDRHNEAIKEFMKTLKIDPAYLKAYNGIGISYDRIGDFKTASNYYKKALSINPDIDYVLNNLGYSYIYQGRFNEAVDALAKAVSLNKENKRYRNNLGLAYAKSGRFEEALAQFKLVGDDAMAYYNMGRIYYEKDLFKEAKAHFIKALAINPSFMEARSWLEAAEAMAQIYQPVDKEAGEIKSADFGPPADINPEKEESGGLPAMAERIEEDVNRQAEKNARGSFHNVQIEISNGNGVHRMARRLGDYLENKRFERLDFLGELVIAAKDSILYI